MRASALPSLTAVVAGAILLCAAIGVASVRSTSLALGLALGLLFVAVCFVDLAAGLGAFTVLIFFERFAGSTGAAKLAGFVLAVAWAAAILARGRETPFLARRRPWIAVGVALFFVFTFASALWAPDSGRAISNAARMAQVIILFLVAYSAARDGRRVGWLVWAFMTGAFCAAATGLVTGQGFANTSRLSGGILDPNFLAASLVAAVAMGVVLLLSPDLGFGRRLALGVFIATDLVAILRTESRGGIVALAVALVLIPLVAGPLRVRAVAAVFVTVAVCLTYFSYAASVQTKQRLTNVTAGGGGGRTDQWSLALRVVHDHPALGVGLANFPVVESQYTASNVALQDVSQVLRFDLVVHNSYLETLAELGPVGLAAFLLAVCGPLVVAARFLRRSRAPNLEVRALFVALAALLVAYFFLSGEYEKQLWLLAGLTLGAVDALPAARRADAFSPALQSVPGDPVHA